MAFAVRHQRALAALADRVGLDYFTVDCAENKRGELLIFEADNTAVVHNMDSPELFPYKAPQMRKIFEAFAAMLYRRAGVPAASMRLTGRRPAENASLRGREVDSKRRLSNRLRGGLFPERRRVVGELEKYIRTDAEPVALAAAGL